MIEYQKQADNLKKQKEETEKWFDANFASVPEPVRKTIVRGLDAVEEARKKYEEWARRK